MNDEESESTSVQSNFRIPTNISQEDIQQKAKELVRLAISNSITDMPLKRDEIRKKVIKDNMKIFPLVFEEAQKILEKDYSMELVEYPTRGSSIISINHQKDNNSADSSQASSSQAPKKSVKKYPTNSYILKNILPSELRKGITFSKEDYQLHGLLIIVLCLVYINSNHLREENLYKLLENFGIYKNQEHIVFGNIENCISQFTQKGYLEKEKNTINNEEIFFTYKWGSRTLVEFPENNLLNFITGFYEEKEKEQIKKELKRSLGIN